MNKNYPKVKLLHGYRTSAFYQSFHPWKQNRLSYLKYKCFFFFWGGNDLYLSFSWNLGYKIWSPTVTFPSEKYLTSEPPNSDHPIHPSILLSSLFILKSSQSVPASSPLSVFSGYRRDFLVVVICDQTFQTSIWHMVSISYLFNKLKYLLIQNFTLL